MDKRVFFSLSALLFAVSACVTIVWCASMPASMVWMRMPGQTWLGAAASFLGMWTVMMVPMMLPSLAPVLWRERLSLSNTALAAIGYFFVWAVIGVAVYPLGVALSGLTMRPIAVGLVIVLAGAFQLTTWGCPSPPANIVRHWQRGLRLGLNCAYCCAGLMAILLVIGVTDLRAMALVTIAVTVVRLAPESRRTTPAALPDTRST